MLRSETDRGAIRIAGIDTARGLAVFGMFAVHITPQVAPWVPAVVVALPDGRSSILFATLAGVSISLMSGGHSPVRGAGVRAASRRIAIRAGGVFLIGVALILLHTPIAVILTYYGVLFVLALPFLRLRMRGLIVAAAVSAVAGPLLLLALSRLVLPTGAADRIEAWDPLHLVPGTGVIDLLFTGAYPVVTWLPFVLAGMAVGRLDLRRLRFGVLALAGAGLALIGYGTSAVLLAVFALPAVPTQIERIGGVAVPAWSGILYDYPHSGTPFEIVGGLGVALLVLDVCLVLTRRLPATLWPITAVGAMPLTIYTLQALLLELPGLRFDGTDSIWVLVAFGCGSSVLAMAWLARNRRGPLEALLHLVSKPRGYITAPM